MAPIQSPPSLTHPTTSTQPPSHNHSLSQRVYLERGDQLLSEHLRTDLIASALDHPSGHSPLGGVEALDAVQQIDGLLEGAAEEQTGLEERDRLSFSKVSLQPTERSGGGNVHRTGQSAQER